MEIVHNTAALRARLKSEDAIGFVPTMGNLHAGHIDLTRIARDLVDKKAGKKGCVVVSIFVNRMQFGPKEDFGTYPRTLGDDCDKCRAAGVDVVFAPDESEMYPEPQTYVVDPPEIQHVLEGAVRPGHYRGVATVVLKLFNMVQPQFAVFGKKDYQQCRVLDNMVRQFNLPIEIVLGETVRADDGLALSSRNGYLSAAERAEAPQLNAVLRSTKSALLAGNREFATLETAAQDALKARGWLPDYVTIRRQSDLQPAAAADRALVVLAAARIGSTRLIDNLEVTL
ncbi:MAG: pantoate--beta-alanine ligase [Usitatibacteraceae bacterium]